MLSDSSFVFALIAVTAALMASNKVRYDIVALMVVLALMLSGVLTVGEALGGFGSSVVMLVACLLVVGEMLDRTGVAAAIGDWILKKGGSNETRLLILLGLAGCGDEFHCGGGHFYSDCAARGGGNQIAGLQVPDAHVLRRPDQRHANPDSDDSQPGCQ